MPVSRVMLGNIHISNGYIPQRHNLSETERKIPF